MISYSLLSADLEKDTVLLRLQIPLPSSALHTHFLLSRFRALYQQLAGALPKDISFIH